MKQYKITFTCKDQNYQFVIDLSPDTELAIKELILAQIKVIKEKNDIEKYQAKDINVKYSRDEGESWFLYNVYINETALL